MNGIPYTKYQTFREGEGSYRFLRFPLPPQQLQLLYPGRLMSNQWHHNGDNIPNEDPQDLAYTQSHMSALQRAAAIEEEALARHLGGKHKVARHPFVEPEAVIEDPDLRFVNTLDNSSPNLSRVSSGIPSMRTIDRAGERLSETSLAESSRAEKVARLSQDTGLPPRVIREGFQYPGRSCKTCAPRVSPFSPAKKTHGAHPPDFVTPAHAPPYWRESFELTEAEWKKELEKIEKEIENLEKDLKKNHLWMWLAIGGGLLLLLIVVGVVIYEATRK